MVKSYLKGSGFVINQILKISEGSPADKLVEEIVLEMMKKNDSAKDKFDKTYITPRSVCTWLKKDLNRKRKTFNQNTLKRYFAFHKDEIDLHNKKHDLNAEHNKLKYHYLKKKRRLQSLLNWRIKMRNCIICSLNENKRKEFEEKIREGEYTIREIRDELNFSGIKISEASLTRHKLNHMKMPKKLEIREEHPTSIEVASIMSRLNKEIMSRDYKAIAVEERLKTSIMMERICRTQQVIVDTKLKRHCEGKVPYPSVEIRGLKTILDLIEKLPNYSDKSLNFEIDQVSKKAREATLENLVNLENKEQKANLEII